MIILFISDIHINLSKHTTWEQDRVTKLFSTLAATKYDKIVLGGDIFDKATPSLEELNLFYNEVTKLHDVTIIAGNHENIDGTKSTFDLIPQVGYTYYDDYRLELENIDLYFISHHKLTALNGIKQELRDKVNILFSHIRCTVPPFIKEEYPLEYLSNTFDLVLLGDIHFKNSPYDNIHYPGQPYSHKFNPKVETGYYLLDISADVMLTYYHLDLPTKIKLTLPIDKLKDYHFVKTNLYKVKVTGTVEEVHSLPQLGSNVVYEKHITTEDTQSSITTSTSKLDIVDTLLDSTKRMFSLSDKVMEQGEALVHTIVNKS